ncbi:hypothetical protein NPIL_385571 [Nephila pilipes]|uniref:Uncharacterized protein n=1 Tax=Nephila pilipes TaxID=299642 RepID=A0A8X6PF89_NEPPI|nr:hypothetical protein NPIL_385571 [Nephila pilipes]
MRWMRRPQKHLPLKFSGETTNEACLPVLMRCVGMPTTTLPDLGADLSSESGQERDVTSPARGVNIKSVVAQRPHIDAGAENGVLALELVSSSGSESEW